MRHVRCLLVLALVMVPCAAAEAQEKGQVGLTFGYPTSFGLVFHATDRVAIRPDFALSRTSGEGNPTESSSTTTDGSAFGVGVSALFYVHTIEKLRIFLAPRFNYGRTTSSSTSVRDSSSTTLKTTYNTYTATGSIGAQYALSRWFSVVGEVGFEYNTRHAASSGTVSSSGTNRSYEPWTAIWAVFYFK